MTSERMDETAASRGAQSRAELLAQVDRHTWLYTVDLGEGVQTRGLFGPPHTHIRDALDQIEVCNKKVLDVGCWEGHWSFEVERRGAAAVYATDYLVGDPRAEVFERGLKELPTFRLAHEILGSKVSYHPDVSVYHITELGVTDFDVVLFCGVYYHLKHPLLALAKLRQVMKDDGIIIVEGAVVEGPQEASARFYYSELLGDDASNWWVPTLPCLRQWIECSFFEPISEHGPAYQSSRAISLFPGREPGFGSTAANALDATNRQGSTEIIARYGITARAVRRRDSKYVFPDEDLVQYNLNDYR
jgi:tRNA (mo5U34)-methyltransferase